MNDEELLREEAEKRRAYIERLNTLAGSETFEVRRVDLRELSDEERARLRADVHVPEGVPLEEWDWLTGKRRHEPFPYMLWPLDPPPGDFWAGDG